MKTLLRLLVFIFLGCTLAVVGAAMVKPKNFGSVSQTRSSIAIDPAGFPHVAYQGADRHLYHARYDGQTWARELVDDSQYYDNAVAIDSQGHIHIVYGAERVKGDTYTYPLVHADFDGTSWQVTDLPVSGFNPEIAVDADRHLHVLYRSSSTFGYGVYDGTDWQFEDTGLPWSWYSNGLVLDADGNAHISYSVNYAGCFYATNKSGTWESTKLTSDAAGATAIGLDTAGHPLVVTGIGGALVSYTYNGSNWTNETIVDFNDADPMIQAHIETAIALAVDAQGHAQIMVPVYLTDGNRYADVSTFVYHDGSGWNGLLLDPKNTGFGPSIALDTNGVAYVTYYGGTKAKWARIALSDLTGAWTNVSVVGFAVTGALTVTNHGLEKSAKTTAALWLSDDATLDASDTLLPMTLKIKSLQPGRTIAAPINFQNAGPLAGKYLIAVIDPDLATADRNQLDNKIAVLLGP